MIELLIPLTRNKIEILNIIYEKHETYLSEIARELKLHPYSVQKTLLKLKPFLKEKKAGKTNLVLIDKSQKKKNLLIELIEDYKSKTKNKTVNSIIKHIENLFSDENIVCSVLFGSYARLSFTKDSDVDLLLIVKKVDKDINNKISQLSSIIGKEVNPLIFTKTGFKEIIKNKEVTILSLRKPQQRIIISGIDYFVKNLAEG
ncbi:MAG: nucleotidyltransferase domain-containing protein [Nanoarchaeota archaeon]|nr:nucleotidyltransferase domain-containing protein [Nanoarchaeota archaeon]